VSYMCGTAQCCAARGGRSRKATPEVRERPGRSRLATGQIMVRSAAPGSHWCLFDVMTSLFARSR